MNQKLHKEEDYSCLVYTFIVCEYVFVLHSRHSLVVGENNVYRECAIIKIIVCVCVILFLTPSTKFVQQLQLQYLPLMLSLQLLL